MNENDWADLARELIRAVNDNGPNAAEIWSAIGTWITLIVGGVALFFAKGQLDEASRARTQTKELELEKSQPYVVLAMEESTGPDYIDLVLRNYGQTAAHNVRVTLDPRPKRAYPAGDVKFPEIIPLLAPGQEWRTHWDMGSKRAAAKLPQKHKGTVTYLGIKKAPQTTEVILDWSVYNSHTWTVKRGLHDLAKAVMDIRDTHEGWNEERSGGLAVHTRDGDAKDAAAAREKKEIERELEAERALRPPASKRVRNRNP
ncbi:hypothetical protein QMY03_09580 [Arthrobacter sp. KFRI-F3372]|nr:hypothetical protein QMY03_09580 [Arthrobacter sp. KFRI-F3372]